jgi:hypothetical protein
MYSVLVDLVDALESREEDLMSWVFSADLDQTRSVRAERKVHGLHDQTAGRGLPAAATVSTSPRFIRRQILRSP